MDINNDILNHNDDCNNNEYGDVFIEFKNFFEEDLNIRDAKKYDVVLKENIAFNDFIKIITNLKKLNIKDKKDILVNNLSIKNDKIVKKYLQQNCLILSLNDVFFDDNLSLRDNISIVSYLFTGFDLSQASLSSFGVKDIENKLLKDLTCEQKKIYVLSYCIACPEIIWIIDEKILHNLSNQSLELFDNAVKIRIKHGGVVLLVREHKLNFIKK